MQMESRTPAKTPPPDPQLDRKGEQWQLVERILASPGFAKSPRLSSFLSYVCRCALEGRSGETQEQKIGMRVFGRPDGYNPSEDSVVRSQARLLRQKLDEYFESEGRDEPIRVVVPKGSYVPQFVKPSESKAVDPAGSGHAEGVRSFSIGFAALGALLLLVCALLATDIWAHLRAQTPRDPQPLWTALFNPRQRTIIVPSDSTLVLLEELTRTSVHLTDYSDHTYLHKMPLPTVLGPLTVDDLAGHQYTSMADLNLAVRLAKLPEANHQVEIRFARNLTLSDMKEANLVLIGGERSNPWTELFERQTRFHVNYDVPTKTNTVVDLAPQKGAAATYAERTTGTDRIVYGVVAFLPGMCEGCDAMLVQGTSMAGTEGASDFLFGNQGFREFLHKIARPDGSVPHFELLLQASSVGGNAPKASILAYDLL